MILDIMPLSLPSWPAKAIIWSGFAHDSKPSQYWQVRTYMYMPFFDKNVTWFQYKVRFLKPSLTRNPDIILMWWKSVKNLPKSMFKNPFSLQSFLLPSTYMKKKKNRLPCWPSQNLALPVSRMFCKSRLAPTVVGESKVAKVLTLEENMAPPRMTLPSKWVTLHPETPLSPSQLCDFSWKRFVAIYKEMYEAFSRIGWLGTRTSDNVFPC